jgi:hypothetical protein
MHKDKSNLDIVRSYLSGERPWVQIGYTGKKYTKRNVGDRWTDNRGIEWEQKVGGPTRVNKMAEAIREARGKDVCKKCQKEMRWGDKTDQLFFRKTGLCTDCLITYETNLRILGIHSEYETMKLASNEMGFLKDARDKISETLNFFQQDGGDVTMICNSEGFVERWKNTNREQIIEDAKRDLKLIKKYIANLSKLKNKCKKIYVENAKKYNLEIYV